MMKIQLIAEGSTKQERLIRRWGLSFIIGENVLFDAFGDAKVFQDNLKRFNVDILKIKHIVLSHDDWDHIAGLWDLLESKKDVCVYICPGFKEDIKQKILSFGVNLIEVKEAREITQNVYSSGELYGKAQDREIFEQSLVIKTKDGLVVICGCAHPGVNNIVNHVEAHFKEKVCALVGGFHLKDNDE
ncbi:MBL fold metallo-hydrolase, partial [Candidatus Nomurabacteria bacterium]|nr:MBL fold metallo-hydrolase [Candidatus Nomurabacteria bacterium]